MGRGKRAKSGGADEGVLRRDREEKQRANLIEARQEGDADAADDKDDAFISFLGKANGRQNQESESEDVDAFDLAAGGTSSDDDDENSEEESGSDSEDDEEVSYNS